MTQVINWNTAAFWPVITHLARFGDIGTDLFKLVLLAFSFFCYFIIRHRFPVLKVRRQLNTTVLPKIQAQENHCFRLALPYMIK